ncbi:hypothetical protein SE91_14805 [Bradyrhizobium sp. DOA1]|nr:hypothetical protein SE91_14805 [Bradyrhizobium sp. DOA1]
MASSSAQRLKSARFCESLVRLLMRAIRVIGTEFVQFFPEVRHDIGLLLDLPGHAATECRSTKEHADLH